MTHIRWKAEASEGKGRLFYRKYRGINPYTENGVHLEKGSFFGLRQDNKGAYIVINGQDTAISPMVFTSLMRSSIADKE